jgi:hypothetical protein
MPNYPFKPGNTFSVGHGRPRGSRNKVARRVLEDILAHWFEPAANGSDLHKGREALETLYKTKPDLYAKLVASLLPRDLIITSAMDDLSDDQVDDVIARIREQLEARQSEALALELKAEPVKVIANGKH